MRLLRIDQPLANRIFGLDLVRAVAIGLVLLLNGDPLLRRNFPDYPRFWFIDGVDLFFVLSGFLIGRILIDAFEENGYSLPAIRRFWKFRWFRTLPNYYLILVVTILFVYTKDGNIHDVGWRYFFFLQNLTGPIPRFFSVSWSLVVEEWFYLTFPLVVYLLSRFVPRLTARRAILMTTGIFIAVPLMLRLQMVFDNVSPSEFANLGSLFNFEMQFRSVAMYRLDSIAFGVLGAYISFYHPDAWRRYRLHAFVTGLLMYLFFRARLDDGLAKFAFSFTICSFALSLLLPLASTISSAPKWVSVPVTHLSVISYSAYLIHRTLVMDAFRAYGGRPFTDLQAVAYYVAYFIITIFLSTLLYKYFELPVMRLRERRFSPRAPKPLPLESSLENGRMSLRPTISKTSREKANPVS